MIGAATADDGSTPRGGTGWLERSRRGRAGGWLVLLVALSLRLMVSDFRSPRTSIGDWPRFREQAVGLMKGEGYCTTEYDRGGRLECGLPPGYPVLLAVVMTATSRGEAIEAVLVLLSTLSCLLVYLALRHRGEGVGLLAGLGMAVHPWLILASSLRHYSETFGTFLVALLCLCVSRVDRRRDTDLDLFLLGAGCVAAILTSPATIFLCTGFWAYVAWTKRRSLRALVLLSASSLLVMTPWQIHCWCATGRIQWTVLSDDGMFHGPWFDWLKTWIVKPTDHLLAQKGIEFVPDRAFSGPKERARVLEAARRSHADFELVITEVTREKIARSPLRHYVLLPAVRSATLWLEMLQAHHAQPDYIPFLVSPSSWKASLTEVGRARTLQRAGKALFSLLVYVLYLSYHALFAFGVVSGLRKRLPVSVIAAVAVAAYTAICAFNVLIEARRNLPFFPALFLASMTALPRRERTDAGAVSKESLAAA